MLKIWRLSAVATRSPRGGRTLKLGPGGGLGILSGVIGDSSAGIAEYSRAIHSLGANDVPSFLSAGSALGLEVVLTALFLYVFFNATSAVAKPEMAGLTIGGYPLVAHLIGVPLGDSSLILLAASGQPFFRGKRR